MARRGNGEGSIYQRGDGRWVAALTIGNRRRVLYGTTRRQVAEKLAALHQDANTGRLVHPTSITVAAFLHTWLDAVRTQLRPTSWASYEELARVHVLPALGGLRLQTLRPLHLVQLYAERTHAGVSARRVQMVHRLLHKALGDAVRWHTLPLNPAAAVSPPRPRRAERQVWNEGEAQRFLEAVQTYSHTWDSLWAFLLGSGCRVGEALGPRWADIAPQRGTVRIVRAVAFAHNQAHEGPPKTTSGVRALLLPPFALDAVQVQRRRQAEWRLRAGPTWASGERVFTTSLGSLPNLNNLLKAFRAACRRAGVPVLRIHDLRHEHATLALRSGADLKTVQRRLGHASLTMTLGLYAHGLTSGDSQAAALLQRVLAPDPPAEAVEQ